MGKNTSKTPISGDLSATSDFHEVNHRRAAFCPTRWLQAAVLILIGIVVVERSFALGVQYGRETTPAYIKAKQEYWGYVEPVSNEGCDALLESARALLTDRENLLRY